MRQDAYLSYQIGMGFANPSLNGLRTVQDRDGHIGRGKDKIEVSSCLMVVNNHVLFMLTLAAWD